MRSFIKIQKITMGSLKEDIFVDTLICTTAVITQIDSGSVIGFEK